jgi:hypothetical protein
LHLPANFFIVHCLGRNNDERFFVLGFHQTAFLSSPIPPFANFGFFCSSKILLYSKSITSPISLSFVLIPAKKNSQMSMAKNGQWTEGSNRRKRVVRRTVPNLVTLSLLIIQFDKTVVPYAEEIDELALRRDSSTTPPPPAPSTGSTLLSRQLVIPTSPRELIQRKK